MIKLIEQKSEEKFLIALEGDVRQSLNRGVLVCNFSRIGLVVRATVILPFLKATLRDQEGEIYFCEDGDILVCWRGRIREVMESVIAAFIAQYPHKLNKDNRSEIFQFYDNRAQDEELRLLLRHKLQRNIKDMVSSQGEVQKTGQNEKWLPVFQENQLLLLQAGIAKRRKRGLPELLIVEDQDFSRRLLLGLLEKHFVCHSAVTAHQAVNLYAEYAPDITFLDVELPEANGHQLAALFKRIDPESYIVMVTGNHYSKDVEMAKANKVQGFIVKPYNKQKIVESIENYMKQKNK